MSQRGAPKGDIKSKRAKEVGRMARQTLHIECRINGELEPVAQGELAPGILVAMGATFNLLHTG